MTSHLQIDRGRFLSAFGRTPTGVRHSLVDSPLLTLGAIAELVDALPVAAVERHSAALPVVMAGPAPEVSGRPADTVRGIETNGCWMVLWNIEQHPAYRRLLDGCLDEVEEMLALPVGGMRRREGFLFLSAPGATTPVHIDPEHNFLLQIRGSKDMNVCRFDDRETELRELCRYYDGGHRNLDTLPAGCQTFTMSPADGTYVPSFAPHWVQNGPAVSISLSITFRTRDSERHELVQAMNARLRKMHLSPPPPGTAPRVDAAKAAVMRSWRLALHRGRTLVHPGYARRS